MTITIDNMKKYLVSIVISSILFLAPALAMAYPIATGDTSLLDWGIDIGSNDWDPDPGIFYKFP